MNIDMHVLCPGPVQACASEIPPYGLGTGICHHSWQRHLSPQQCRFPSPAAPFSIPSSAISILSNAIFIFSSAIFHPQQLHLHPLAVPFSSLIEAMQRRLRQNKSHAKKLSGTGHSNLADLYTVMIQICSRHLGSCLLLLQSDLIAFLAHSVHKRNWLTAAQPLLSAMPNMTRACRSEHTLPVTSIHVGAGQANAIAVTASLDRSCKIWSLAQGKQCTFRPA